MNKLGTALLSASALLVAGTAAAELPEWTYGQIGYLEADTVGSDQTHAYNIDASVGFLDVWHLQLGYNDGSLGAFDSTSDFNGYNVTVGAHPAINEKSQLVFNFRYFDTSFDGGEGSSDLFGSDVDVDGFGVGFGVRSNVTDKVEASALAYWTDANVDGTDGFFEGDNLDTTTVSVVLGGRYNWTKNFSTGATVVIGDTAVSPVSDFIGDSNSMSLDVRYTFAGLRL